MIPRCKQIASYKVRIASCKVRHPSHKPDLEAVKNGNFHVIFHQFYNSPYHFIAIQQLAKWFYPEDFEDLDPQATFAELHERFLPFGVSGTFWMSAEGRE